MLLATRARQVGTLARANGSAAQPTALGASHWLVRLGALHPEPVPSRPNTAVLNSHGPAEEETGAGTRFQGWSGSGVIVAEAMGGGAGAALRSRERSPVSPRLGNVLYVLACLVAVLALALGAMVFFLADPSSKAGQNPIAVLAVSVVVALLIWGIGEGLRYILVGPSALLKRKQLEERLTALEERIDAVDTRLTRYEETVGPQLRTLGSLLHQALSKRDKAEG